MTITNTFDTGAIQINKVIDGPAAGFVPDGTAYSVEVSCAYLGDELPVRTVTLQTPDQLSATVDGLPIGADCAINETGFGGASVTEIAPQTVTVGTDGPAAVTVTNTYDAGAAGITKMVQGELAALAPDAFPIEVSCTYPDGFPATGPIPGYDPRRLELGDGESAEVGPLPIGTSCDVVEADDGGASTVTIEPESFVIESAADAVEVTITNDFPPAGLQIVKEVTGPGAVWVPEDTRFTARVTCTDDGQVALDQEIALTAGAPELLTGLPPGATCTVTETQTNGAAAVEVSPNPIPPLTEGSEPVSVTITNTFDTGAIQINKVIAGAGAAFAVGPFEVAVSCTYLDRDLPAQAVTLMPPDGLSAIVEDLPIGADCAITEIDAGGTSSTVVVPDSVTVGPDGPAVVTVTNTYDAGAILIEKVIVGPAELATGPFVFAVECSYLGSEVDLEPGTISITPPATSVIVPGLPIGGQCSISELAPYGGADGPGIVAPGSVLVNAGDPVVVTATNTFTAPPRPPDLVRTGAVGWEPMLWGGLLLLGSGSLLLLHTRRRSAG